ncbi:MAG: hypothetical protein HKN23_21420 [Verrucomicrobiales bacterium]|nr:hypothetical protein [Verrucomicrobiales bacterium]
MKLLAAIFYLGAFAGVMAVAHFTGNPEAGIQADQKNPEPVETDVEEVSLDEHLSAFNGALDRGDFAGARSALEKISTDKSVSSETISLVRASLTGAEAAAKKAETQSGETREQVEQIGKDLLLLEKDFTGFTERQLDFSRVATQGIQSASDTAAQIQSEIRKIGGRLAVIETRLEEVEKKAIERQPEPVPGPDDAPEPSPEPPTPLASIPRGVSVSFGIGSIDFTAPARKSIQSVAEMLIKNSNLQVSLQGSATGFSSALGTGRARAVKAKLAEYGVPAERVTISPNGGAGADSVSISFRKKNS